MVTNILLFKFGPWEIGLILIVVLLLFGSKKIPEIAKGLGKGVKEFKKATDDIKKEISEVEITKEIKEIKKNISDVDITKYIKEIKNNLKK